MDDLTLTRVALSIDGMDWYGWKEAQITLSMEQGAGTFQLTLTEQWAGSVRRPIGPGAACSVSIDGELVIKGWVDDVEPAYDAESHDLTVRGRDATGDLVDCAVLPPFEYRGLTLTEIATRIAAPFSIPVRAEVDVGKPFERFAVQPGETAWEAIERAARMRAVLAMADGRGGLLLTRAGTGQAPAPLVLGGNVLAARGQFTFKDRFSEYHALGQQEGSDAFGDAAEASAPNARVTDTAVRRYRPTILLGEAQGDDGGLKQRAEWQKAVNAGRSKRATYTVQDWRAAGALWRPNARVSVVDAYMNLDGEELFIPRVTMALSEAGTFAGIEVAPLDAYKLEPESKAQADKREAGKAARSAEKGKSGGGDPFSLWDAN
ncbi:phage baseplate assembly protein [Mesorhizobium sp. KR1-2]|uniref:phage baseplate assembly protein n=1 Tax=Mesorhizobium sp. KR1-2 TaxID=3156609 RepID=UPI0032B33952